MADVQFQEEAFTRAAHGAPSKGITGTLMRAGIAKSPAQANVIMVLLILACIIATGFSLTAMTGQKELPPEAVRTAEWMRQGNVGMPPASFNP